MGRGRQLNFYACWHIITSNLKQLWDSEHRTCGVIMHTVDQQTEGILGKHKLFIDTVSCVHISEQENFILGDVS